MEKILSRKNFSSRGIEARRTIELERQHARIRQEEPDEDVMRATEGLARQGSQECKPQNVQSAEWAMMDAEEEVYRELETARQLLQEAEVLKAHAEEVVQRAVKAEEEAEGRVGGQSSAYPTTEELLEARQQAQYEEGHFHLAVTGNSGSGKSSLVNAFRGLRNHDAGSAAVGAVETTLKMTRYPDVNPENPYVWYDIPGAGTFSCPASQYFNNQGLYVFDCIIVVIDTRFTEADIAILANANLYKVPTFIVRSKADQYIDHSVKDRVNGEEDTLQLQIIRDSAREEFVQQTRDSIRTNLQNFQLPDQPVYIVSHTTLRLIWNGEQAKDSEMIDERKLLDDLERQAYKKGRSY